MSATRLFGAKVDAAKRKMEDEVSLLYESYHRCEDSEKRAEIKRRIDAMIEEIERKKEATSKSVR